MQTEFSPVLLFFLDWGVSTALEVLHSSLPKVGCLSLFGRVDVLVLEAEACESNVPTVFLGEGRCQSLFLFSSHEAPAVADLLDSACTKETALLRTLDIYVMKCQMN